MPSKQSSAAVASAFRRAIQPDPYIPVSEWADERRILPSKGSSEPGRWRTSRTPYLRDVMDAASPGSGVERIVLQFGTQLGKTEGLFNVMGAVVDLYPAPIMYVQPTVETVQRVSKQRIQPMFDETPALRDKVTENRSREGSNTIQQKDFKGGSLVLTGANSAPGLRSMPVKILLLDEVDAYPEDVGGEGDPIELAVKRTTNFPGRKIVLVSSPKIKGRSKIEKARTAPDATDEHYQVPCPECDTLQPLLWDRAAGGGLRWKSRETARGPLVERVWYECAACSAEIDESQKTTMLENGVWVPRNLDASGRTRSFQLSSLYSPIGWYSWRDAVEDFLKANEEKKKTGDLSGLIVWTNTVLAETWEADNADVIEIDEIAGRGGDFDARDGELPAGAFIVTLGVDIQGDRLEAELIAWGEHEESWRIDYMRVMGDPGKIRSADSPWHAIDALLRRTWKSPEGVEVRVSATAIDSQGHHAQSAYEWIRPRQSRRVYACKGSSTAGQELIRLSKTRNKRPVSLLLIGTEGAKDLIFSRLKVEEPGPGFTHFPAFYGEEYFEGLTSEKAINSRQRGRDVRRWVKKRPGIRNEPVDLAVLNLVALHSLGSVDWESYKRKHERYAEDGPPEPKPKSKGRSTRKKAGFVGGWKSGRGRMR